MVGFNSSQVKKKMVKIPKKSMTHKHSNEPDAFLIQEAPRKSRDGLVQRNGNAPAVTG